MHVDNESRHWLLLIYRAPQDPPGRRTYVWRQLKQLGAVYLQQAAAILPDQPEVRAVAETLSDWIRDVGGEVSLLETSSPNPDWETNLVARFNDARDEEYAEVVENVERFEDEVARESRRGKFTFAELEDLESDWEKLQRWDGRVRARDFFEAPGRQTLIVALRRAQTDLETFTASVYAHENVQDSEEPNDSV